MLNLAGDWRFDSPGEIAREWWAASSTSYAAGGERRLAIDIGIGSVGWFWQLSRWNSVHARAPCCPPRQCTVRRLCAPQPFVGLERRLLRRDLYGDLGPFAYWG